MSDIEKHNIDQPFDITDAICLVTDKEIEQQQKDLIRIEEQFSKYKELIQKAIEEKQRHVELCYIPKSLITMQKGFYLSSENYDTTAVGLSVLSALIISIITFVLCAILYNYNIHVIYGITLGITTLINLLIFINFHRIKYILHPELQNLINEKRSLGFKVNIDEEVLTKHNIYYKHFYNRHASMRFYLKF